MTRKLVITFVVVVAWQAGCARDAMLTPPRAGMTIERSAVFQRGAYRLPVPPSDEAGAVITVRGDNVTLDFGGATLDGADSPDTTPDQFRGTAVRIDGGTNVTIKNLNVRGYKVALHARNVQRLHITNCDFSYNYRQRLRSTLAREDLSDWMSYHQNDADEWLRYGAGIYLHDCDHAEVDRCTITGGQNGLMMTRCDDGRFWNNNISFNSGVGIGLYRSSRNRVMHNRLDWNVRGYSHGVYHRGQDSAAILVYEQSCANTFAYNSATHSGDGFFLWAGQTTMDTGEGGCNDNYIVGNDFSYAPTNGVEVTFSRNMIGGNVIAGCDHGIWGGYSYGTMILGNEFKDNRIGIAIEHGQQNRIDANRFQGDKSGIRLWSNPKQDPNWGYPRHRDTRSRDYTIINNLFVDVAQPIDISRTSDTVVRNNGFGPATQPVKVGEDVSDLRVLENDLQRLPSIDVWMGMFPLNLKHHSALPSWPKHLPRGRKYILIDEWGPYDFKSPKLWPRENLEGGKQRFEILGPPGTWKLRARRGAASLSAESGSVPGELVVALAPGKVVDLDIRLEYTGSPVVSPFGMRIAAGDVYPFGFTRFVAPIDWTVRWFEYDDATDPRARYDAFKQLLESQPIKEEKTKDLAYAWYGAIGKEPGLPADKFATLATGALEVPLGEYDIEVTSDDGVRVWLDERLVIDNWTYHVPTTDVARVTLVGRHGLRVEHFEIDGFATLKLQIVPARRTPTHRDVK